MALLRQRRREGKHELCSLHIDAFDDSLIDYTVLGKEAFGKGGDRIVLGILGAELFLALVSFFINIGINVNVIFNSELTFLRMQFLWLYDCVHVAVTFRYFHWDSNYYFVCYSVDNVLF